MPLVPTTREHAGILADTLKPDHQREMAWFGQGTKKDVRRSVEQCGDAVLSAVHEGKLLFIAGVSREPSLFRDAAVIAYLATTEYDGHKRAALRMTRRLFEVEAWKHTAFSRIEQYLPPPYTTGIRFLEWLGWTRGDVLYVGSRQAVHMYFDRGSDGRI